MEDKKRKEKLLEDQIGNYKRQMGEMEITIKRLEERLKLQHTQFEKRLASLPSPSSSSSSSAILPHSSSSEKERGANNNNNNNNLGRATRNIEKRGMV